MPAGSLQDSGAPQDESGIINASEGFQSDLNNPFVPSAEPGMESIGTDEPGVPSLGSEESTGEANAASNTAEATTHKWRIRPVLGVGYAYDDNLFLSNTNPTSSSIYSAGAGGAFELGDYRQHKDNFLTLSYLGVGYLFSDAPEQNCYNQYANFLGQYAWDKLSAQFESQYQNVNGANRQVGNFIQSILYYNALRFLYIHSEKTSADLEISQRSNIYVGNINSYFNQAKLGADYQLTRKVTLGAEGILGSNPAQDSPTRYYQILNGRLRYDVTGKVALKATGGIQTSEYESGGVPFKATPVLSLGADYKIFGDAKEGELGTGRSTSHQLFGGGRMNQLVSDSTISLILYRNQQNSPNIQGQDFLATGGEIGFNKGLGRHWSFNISFGYENDFYISNQQGVTADRTDNYFFARPGITYKFLKYLELTAFYERSSNDSTQTYFTWVDNRIGMELKSSF
jgi:hypothetical protein